MSQPQGFSRSVSAGNVKIDVKVTIEDRSGRGDRGDDDQRHQMNPDDVFGQDPTHFLKRCQWFGMEKTCTAQWNAALQVWIVVPGRKVRIQCRESCQNGAMWPWRCRHHGTSTYSDRLIDMPQCWCISCRGW